MAGKIHKVDMYRPVAPAPPAAGLAHDLVLVQTLTPRQPATTRLLLGMIDEFAADGIHFASALDLCPELLVQSRNSDHVGARPARRTDIEFGWDLAKEMGRLDVGQSVAVKERTVLAVEAIEGTDRAILRAGELCPAGGFVVVKVAKPQQDMRFDVPTVGCSTHRIAAPGRRPGAGHRGRARPS